MQLIELKNDKSYWELNLKSDSEIFYQLLKDYPNESAEALTDLVNIHEIHFNQLIQLTNIFEYYELIEWIDEYIDAEILYNYYIKDSIGTDKGTWDMISENGYAFIS